MATPRLTISMLPRVALLNFSVLKAQPTTNTATGISACSRGDGERMRQIAAEKPEQAECALGTCLEHLDERDRKKEVGRILQMQAEEMVSVP